MTTSDRHVGSKTKADVDTLARELCNWGRWGAYEEKLAGRGVSLDIADE